MMSCPSADSSARGARLILSIESIAYRGAGIARHDGCVYFVPGVCPGEKVAAEEVCRKRTYRIARLTEVVEASADRIVSECALPGGMIVPGCVYGHMSHAAELACKQSQLESFLVRQAGVPNAGYFLESPCVSPHELHYRNKSVFHFCSATRALGYYGDDNRTVNDIPQCPLSVVAINDALAGLRHDTQFLNRLKNTDSISFRWTETDGAVVIPPRGRGFRPCETYLTEISPAGVLKVPVGGFYQVNPEVARELVSYVGEIFKRKSPSVLLDFYCGVGVFGIYAARLGVEKVFGYDSGRDVVSYANMNASANGVGDRAHFFCGSGLQCVSRLLSASAHAGTSLVVTDPPRSGMEKDVVGALSENPPDYLVYVSCSPDTLARDLRMLCSSGVFNIETVKMFDMFPRTAHFETVVLLSRGK